MKSESLPPVPLSEDALQRIRARTRQEARRIRVATAEAALHGGFAIGALAWAVSSLLA